MTTSERRITLRGTSVLVREVGAGHPVILINGIGAHVEMWRPLERTLAGMRVVSFDAPGTGRSETRITPLTMFGLARLVRCLMDRLEIERADVVGYSFGGALAQQLAIQSPDRIRRLVLAATVPGWGGVPGHLSAMLSVGTPLRYYSKALYELSAPAVAGGRARYDADHVRDLWRDRAGRAPTLRGYAQQVWAMSAWTSFPCLSRIHAPTLIVVGDDDPLVPLSNPLMMALRMPCARILIAPGEGHFLLLDPEGQAHAPIREFLEAEALDAADVWRNAVRGNQARLSDQLHYDGFGAPPWGIVSALLREVLR